MTCREHFIVHQLLVDIYVEGSIQQRSMKFALVKMCGTRNLHEITAEEYEYIKLLNSQALSNIMSGRRQTKEHVQNRIASIMNRSEEDKAISAEKKRQSMTGKRWKLSAEQRATQNKLQQDKLKSGIPQFNMKAVECLTKEWEHVEYFVSLSQAAKKMNTCYTSICFACRGKYHFAGGYRWRYTTTQNIL